MDPKPCTLRPNQRRRNIRSRGALERKITFDFFISLGDIYIYVYITENSKYWICCKLFGFFKGHEQTNILERGWAKYCFFASPYGVMPFLGLEPDSPVTAFPLDLLFFLSFLVLIAGVVVS